ncbi:LysR family transcriptional regulator [Serratia ureilytica]
MEPAVCHPRRRFGHAESDGRKLIQNLEDHLQTKLFQRTTRSVSVTREGECYTRIR